MACGESGGAEPKGNFGEASVSPGLRVGSVPGPTFPIHKSASAISVKSLISRSG